MNGKIHPALLPAGLEDILPPDAEFETAVSEGLIQAFSRYGFERVKPPLIEFEENLIAGAGAATASQTFRLMDPVSQRMLGLRADMTLQIARIATTRLADLPRPLRLSYAGQVLRVTGSPLRPERQFGQVGAELIGSPSCRADAEVILLAANSLAEVGVSDLSIDLGLPTLVGAVIQSLGAPDEAATLKLRNALAEKDAAAVGAIEGLDTEIFNEILSAIGPAESALGILNSLSLPADAKQIVKNLADVIEAVKARAPDLKMTLDPVEVRGYEYHEGVTFSIFSINAREELGRGGRYLSGNDGKGEPSTGFTLFIDTLLRALPKPKPHERVFLPLDTSLGDVGRLHGDGWITVNSLDGSADDAVEAARLGCSHIYIDGDVCALGANKKGKN
ncbi:MAG: ATP phosphoribosyltransferase regulatory subunit [Rhodospirillales bacterium]|nr:ATP phosphoribosyltransferase regulatory subunit [Rhodospirillales bacterium]